MHVSVVGHGGICARYLRNDALEIEAQIEKMRKYNEDRMREAKEETEISEQESQAILDVMQLLILAGYTVTTASEVAAWLQGHAKAGIGVSVIMAAIGEPQQDRLAELAKKLEAVEPVTNYEKWHSMKRKNWKPKKHYER